MNPANQVLRTGVALAITVGVAYTTCALFFWAWPEAGMSLANALFHGLDFRKLQGGAAAFNFGGFASALVVLVIWSFVLGVLFAWLRGSREPAPR